MPAPIDREIRAVAIVDAAAYGDREAARRHRVSIRTLMRWRVELRTDSEFAAAVKALVDEHQAELGALRVRFLRKALAEMERRLDKADTTLPEIAEAVKVIGELHQVAEAMSDGGSDGDDPEADEAPGGSVGEASATH